MQCSILPVRYILRMRPWFKPAISFVALLFLVLLSAQLFTWANHWRERSSVSDEQKIARTLNIIGTSSPSNRQVLKVLFYGQSITGTKWHQAVIEHWREKYPNTIFVVENRALGGFDATALLRATEQDLAAFYPDLIVFHVYGNHRDYERIIRLFRSRTAADVILQTDHGATLPDPPCTEGLQWRLRPPPGCAGAIWMRQRDWSDKMAYHIIPALARKYDLAVEPQRTWWRDYLQRTGVDPSSMLVDYIHPNEKGKALIADFFDDYFDGLVAGWRGQTEHNVTSIPVPLPAAAEESVRFDGDRIELISSKPLADWPVSMIDGRSAEEVRGCYRVSRASAIATLPDWPAIRRITLSDHPVAQDWSAEVSKISADQKSFEFAVRGSLTGRDGNGASTGDFRSNSGQLRIAAEDWMFERAFELTKKPIQSPFEVHWSVEYICGGKPEVVRDADGQAVQYRYVAGAGLSSRSHTLQVHGSKEDLANLMEFRVYKPPLGE